MKAKVFLILSGYVVLLFLSNCAKPIEACFDYNPTYPDTVTSVFFNASCTENAVIFDWNFGDGSDTTTENLSVTHKYKAPGTYTIRLNAKRKSGVTVRKEKPVIEKVILVQ